jgi:hypothetical protein
MPKRPHWTVVWEVVEDRPWSEFDKDPLTALIETQHGVVASWQARRFLSEKAIRHRVASGRWRRAHRRVFVAYGGPLTWRQRLWIAVLAAGPSAGNGFVACLAGQSALQVHGLRGISATRVHLVVPVTRAFTPPVGVAVHRVRLCDEDRHPHSRPPTTTVGRAVVDAAAYSQSDEQARLLVVASLQQRLVTTTEILDAVDRMPNTKRRRLVIVTSRDADGGSQSLGELALLDICRVERLPLPTRQLTFRDLSGRKRYLDAVFDPWRVAVEVDGAHHDEVGQAWDDIERDNSLILAQYRVLRFPVHVVRQQPRKVAAMIRAALELAGWRPEGAS